MSTFLINKTNTRYEVFKDGERLFNSKFTQIVLHSGLIVFIRDLLSESIVLTLGTRITLPAGSTMVSIVSPATESLYGIEALRESAATVLYNQILIAAGQVESKLTDEPTIAAASTILPPIRQLTNVLTNCLEHMTHNLVSGAGASQGQNLDPGAGFYSSTYDNGVYSVRMGQEQMDFQVDEVLGGPGACPPSMICNSLTEEEVPGSLFRPRKRHFAAWGPGGFSAEENVPRVSPKLSKFTNEWARQVFVGNLPRSVTKEEIANVFSEYGEIEKINIIPNDSNSPLIAFVFFDFESSAQEVLKQKASIQMTLRDGTLRRLNIQAVKPKGPKIK